MSLGAAQNWPRVNGALLPQQGASLFRERCDGAIARVAQLASHEYPWRDASQARRLTLDELSATLMDRQCFRRRVKVALPATGALNLKNIFPGEGGRVPSRCHARFFRLPRAIWRKGIISEQRASSLILQTQEIRAPCRLMRGRGYRVLIP